MHHDAAETVVLRCFMLAYDVDQKWLQWVLAMTRIALGQIGD